MHTNRTPVPDRCGGHWIPVPPAAQPRRANRGAECHDPGQQTAFTMVEILGVIAILFLLAMAVQPAVMKELDIVARGQERTNLVTIASGLQSYAIVNHGIPGTNTMASAIASELGWLTATVQTNALGCPRVFLVDPARPSPSVGTNLTLPFTQAAAGPTSPPVNRVLIVTTMRTVLPASVTSGCTTNAVAFSNLWVSVDGTTPAGWTDGAWDDIMVQRVNLGRLFVQVILNSSSVTNGQYSIDNTNSYVSLPYLPYSAYFLQGSTLGLHTNGGGLQSLAVLQPYGGGSPLANVTTYFYQCPSFVFEKGYWRGALFQTSTIGYTNGAGVFLQSAYDIFMQGPARVNSFGVTQSSLTWDFYLFMSNYVFWASSSTGPSFGASKKAAVTNSYNAIKSDLSYYR